MKKKNFICKKCNGDYLYNEMFEFKLFLPTQIGAVSWFTYISLTDFTHKYVKNEIPSHFRKSKHFFFFSNSSRSPRRSYDFSITWNLLQFAVIFISWEISYSHFKHYISVKLLFLFYIKVSGFKSGICIYLILCLFGVCGLFASIKR